MDDRLMTQQTNGNGKVHLLGWFAFAFSFAIQLVAATWIISSMNSAIVSLSNQVSAIIEMQKNQQLQLNQNTVDIKLIQQCCTKR